jgi:hypothetical protein
VDVGEPLPATLAAPEALLAAAPGELRAIEGMTAALAFGHDRARIVSSASGPATLYEAEGEAIWCCSTHAVAAAWVAHGDARIDPDAVPELLAFDFVGGERTLIAGVRPLPPAADIAIDAGGRRTSAWLVPGERWELVPEREAQAHAEDALLSTVERRLAGRRVSMALTAGLDSRVLAVALTEAGLPFDAFTWGAEGWPDTGGAARSRAWAVPSRRASRRTRWPGRSSRNRSPTAWRQASTTRSSKHGGRTWHHRARRRRRCHGG